MRFTPKLLRLALNFYPPYLGAGVKVTYISKTWQGLHTSISLRWFNRNAVGTHFGGSLYSMVDPHLMLLLMQLLGKGYVVWDKTAEIEFIKASKSKVTAIIKVTGDDLDIIKNKTAGGEKYFSNFVVEIRDAEDDLVALIKKTIYIRKKPPER